MAALKKSVGKTDDDVAGDDDDDDDDPPPPPEFEFDAGASGGPFSSEREAPVTHGRDSNVVRTTVDGRSINRSDVLVSDLVLASTTTKSHLLIPAFFKTNAPPPPHPLRIVRAN
jgi:hypothetical protein